MLSYQRDTSRLFGHPSYYEAVLGYWTGKNHAAGLAVARAIKGEVGQDKYITGTFGLMAISRKTRNLGTLLQFYLRLSYDTKLLGRDFSLAIVHISNGKAIFGWDGPNSGENFVTLSVGLF